MPRLIQFSIVTIMQNLYHFSNKLFGLYTSASMMNLKTSNKGVLFRALFVRTNSVVTATLTSRVVLISNILVSTRVINSFFPLHIEVK